MKIIITIFFSLFLMLTAACSRAVNTDAPPEVFYGEDVCTECGMIITEPRFAAAYYTESGDAKAFDDIGGMCAHMAEADDVIASTWVHDYDTEAWVRAENAFFVVGDMYTPMGFGVVAFATRNQAENMASQEGGMVMGFEEVMAQYADGAGDHGH